ncbi:hypothetical protein [Vibrio owensii]|uniref:hypothetical protein n=1 Tax=Vibrio owensii TaxID=696485 RepID=UPI003CC64214
MKRFVIERESTFSQEVKVPFTFDKSSLDSERLLQAEGVKLDSENPKYEAIFEVGLKALTKHIVEAETKESAESKLKGFVAPSGKVAFTGDLKFHGFIGKLNVVTEPQKLNRDFISELERVVKTALATGMIPLSPGKTKEQNILKNIEIDEGRSPKLPSDQIYNVVQEGEVLQRKTFEIFYTQAKRDEASKKVLLGGISLSPEKDSRKLIVTADIRSTLARNVDCGSLDDSVSPDEVLGTKIVQLTSIKQTSAPEVLCEQTLNEISEALDKAESVKIVEQRFKRSAFTASIKLLDKQQSQTMECTR